MERGIHSIQGPVVSMGTALMLFLVPRLAEYTGKKTAGKKKREAEIVRSYLCRGSSRSGEATPACSMGPHPEHRNHMHTSQGPTSILGNKDEQARKGKPELVIGWISVPRPKTNAPSASCRTSDLCYHCIKNRLDRPRKLGVSHTRLIFIMEIIQRWH